MFALALGLTASTDNLFSFFADLREQPRGWQQGLVDEPAASLAPEPVPPKLASMPTRLPDLRRTALASWPLAAGYLSLLTAQPVLIGGLVQQYLAPSVVASRLLALGAADLPAKWGGAFEQQGHRMEERKEVYDGGRYSQIWTYRWGRREVTVSLDGPFQGWHELGICYLGAGWTTLERSVRPGKEGGGSISEVRLERPPALTWRAAL